MSHSEEKTFISRGVALFLWAMLAIAASGIAANSILSSGNQSLIAMFKLDQLPQFIETRFTPARDVASQNIEDIPAATEQSVTEAILSQRLALLDQRLEAVTQTLSNLRQDTQTIQEARVATLDRIEQLESTFGSITGSLPPQSAAPNTNMDAGSGGDVSVNFSAFPTDQAMDIDGNQPEIGIVGRTEFAVIVARNNDLSSLTRIWARLREEQGSRLEGLEPRIKLENDPESGLQLTLLAGPLRNAQTAIELCAHLALPSSNCGPVLYGGNPLLEFSANLDLE
ncbi:MAG: hypothetical protein JKY32_09775 [Rhizobiales bacterium]|nr:hypothetical protein [Hyphomicrobiales bacterium]